MAFELFNDIKNIITVVKTGAQLAEKAGILGKPEKQQSSFMAPDLDLSSNLRSARPPLREMDAPRGIAIPRIENAFTYVANNAMRDVNIQRIQSRNVPSATPAGKPVNLGGMDSVRKSRVDRNLFRQRTLG